MNCFEGLLRSLAFFDTYMDMKRIKIANRSVLNFASLSHDRNKTVTGNFGPCTTTAASDVEKEYAFYS